MNFEIYEENRSKGYRVEIIIWSDKESNIFGVLQSPLGSLNRDTMKESINLVANHRQKGSENMSMEFK